MKDEKSGADSTDYAGAYSEESFWKKLRRFAVRAGKEIVEKALALYYCLQDRDTPAWAKATIVAALGYFIVPTDAIPDVIPGVGYADDLGALIAALAAVAAHVKSEHWEQAREHPAMKRWFRSTAGPRSEEPVGDSSPS